MGAWFGVVRVDRPSPPIPCSGRPIGKPLAAMAALRMVQEGELSLDADVNTYWSVGSFLPIRLLWASP